MRGGAHYAPDNRHDMSNTSYIQPHGRLHAEQSQYTEANQGLNPNSNISYDHSQMIQNNSMMYNNQFEMMSQTSTVMTGHPGQRRQEPNPHGYHQTQPPMHANYSRQPYQSVHQ